MSLSFSRVSRWTQGAPFSMSPSGMACLPPTSTPVLGRQIYPQPPPHLACMQIPNAGSHACTASFYPLSHLPSPALSFNHQGTKQLECAQRPRLLFRPVSWGEGVGGCEPQARQCLLQTLPGHLGSSHKEGETEIWVGRAASNHNV